MYEDDNENSVSLRGIGKANDAHRLERVPRGQVPVLPLLGSAGQALRRVSDPFAPSRQDRRIRGGEMTAKLPKRRKSPPIARANRLGMAAVQVKTAQELLTTQIRLAHSEGMSLRAIGEAAGVSHEQVRRILGADS